MNRVVLGVAAAVVAWPAFAADLPAGYGRRDHVSHSRGTVWRFGPEPEVFQDRPYIRVVPVRRRVEVRTRTITETRRPIVTK